MSRLPTNSLERALVIMRCIGTTTGGLTNLEISHEFNIARSTCSYILSRLEREGYLARDPGSGKYRLGLETVMLGRGALREIGFRVASEPTLYRLAAETGLAANLAVLERGRVLVLDRIEGFAFVNAASSESAKPDAGGRPSPSPSLRCRHQLLREYRETYEMPVCTTALGKVLLANLRCGQIRLLLDELETRKGPGGEYDFCRAELIAELAAIRETGYCMMSLQPYNESCALAAPILDANRTVRSAVSVSCKRHLAIWNDEHALSELVKEAAWEISSKLQFQKRGPSVQKHATAAAIDPAITPMDNLPRKSGRSASGTEVRP